MSQFSNSDAISVVAILAAVTFVMKIFWGFVDSQAARRRNGSQAPTDRSSAIPSQQPSNEKIIRDYAAFMERHPSLPTRIEDASVLPHQKELIFDALFSAMQQPHTTRMYDSLQIAAMSLVQFQYNVGSEPLEKLGMDLAKLPRTNDLNALRAEAIMLVEAQRKTGDRFNEFDKLVDEDMRIVLAKIAAADQTARDHLRSITPASR